MDLVGGVWGAGGWGNELGDGVSGGLLLMMILVADTHKICDGKMKNSRHQK